ncbi:MAG TPA: hypothetical protein VE650_09555 [Acetobacteraceae bacterium]|nr:hypothetical protein [Acetobacteraceae bacterium]
MTLPPAIVIHGLAHARLALSPGRPVTLLSAPAAALYAGCLWWRAVIAESGARGPDVLDCADAAGRALEALSVGCRWLVLLPCPAWEDVAARAAGYGAVVLRERPAALDLAERGAARRMAAWLC